MATRAAATACAWAWARGPPGLPRAPFTPPPHGETETGGDDEDEHEDRTRVSAAAGRAVGVAFGLRSLLFSSPRPVVFADASGMDPGPRARRRSLFKVRALKTARRRRPELRVHTPSGLPTTRPRHDAGTGPDAARTGLRGTTTTNLILIF